MNVECLLGKGSFLAQTQEEGPWHFDDPACEEQSESSLTRSLAQTNKQTNNQPNTSPQCHLTSPQPNSTQLNSLTNSLTHSLSPSLSLSLSSSLCNLSSSVPIIPGSLRMHEYTTIQANTDQVALQLGGPTMRRYLKAPAEIQELSDLNKLFGHVLTIKKQCCSLGFKIKKNESVYSK